MSKIGEKLLRGASVRVVSQIFAMVIGIMLVPYIVRTLGLRYYGFWTLVGTITGYYGFLDLGLSSALARFVSRHVGRGEKDEADGYITCSFYVFTAAGVVVALLTILAVFLCGLWVKDPQESIIFSRALTIAGISLALTFPFRCFAGILNAHLRFDIISTMDICFTLVRTALVVAVLHAGGTVVSLVVIAGSINLLRSVVTAFLATRIHGVVSLGFSAITRARFRELFGYSTFSFIAQLTELIRQKTIPLIVAKFAGLELLGIFEIALRLRREVMKLCIAMLSIMTPVFSQQEGKGDDTGMKWSYLFFYKISCYCSIFMMAMLAIFAASFVDRWMGPEMNSAVGLKDIFAISSLISTIKIQASTLLYFNNIVGMVQILAISTILAVIQIPTASLLYGTSRNKFYAFSNAIQTAGTLILGVVLIQRIGLIGMIIAELVFNFIVKELLQASEACKVIKISLLHFHAKYTLPNILRPAVFMVVVLFVVRSLLEPNYINLLATALVVTALFLPYIFYIGFTRREREKFLESLALIRQSVRRKMGK
jgi:O-antigen/teichoic acid export membrane protein